MFFELPDGLDTQWMGNSIREYAIALALLIGLLIVLRFVRGIILRKLKSLAERTSTNIDDTVIQVFESLKPPFYVFLAFYLSVKTLSLSGFWQDVFDAMLIIWIVVQVVNAASILAKFLLKRTIADTKEETDTMVNTFSLLISVVLWAVAGLFIISNLGVDVTSLIAGLGVTGIAVAFALQNILADLFSSFAIFFDKPFVVGDFIVVGDDMGVVEKVGLKTTRIRALQGEEIVMSNQELTKQTIHNYKKMLKRRVVFKLGIVYNTSADHVEAVPGIIKQIITDVEETDFDRAHLTEYGDWSINYEVVYFVLSGDYNAYMDANQEIMFKIRRAFDERGISMAFPTQTVYYVDETSGQSKAKS